MTRSDSDYAEVFDRATNFLIGFGIGLLWEATRKTEPDPIFSAYFANSVLFVPMLCGVASYFCLGRIVRAIKWLAFFGHRED